MGDSGILADGTLRLNLPELVLDGVLQVQVAATLPMYLEFRAGRRRLDFRGKGLQEVPSISPVMALFNLPRSIEVWIIDYLQAEDFALQSLSGTLPYDDPAQLLQTLQATAKVTDVAYTFASALPPVSAPEAVVRFAEGRLQILPDQPTYEGIAGEKGGLMAAG